MGSDFVALDKAFFEGLRPETIRGKFYRKTEIDALLKEIAARAELQSSENELLSMKLSTAQNALQEHLVRNDGVNEVAQGIISEANEEADRILAEAKTAADDMIAGAREKSRSIIEATMRQQEYAAAKIEENYSAMMEQHEECIYSLRAAWQEFLIGLEPEGNELPVQSETPADLSEKVASLAEALNDI